MLKCAKNYGKWFRHFEDISRSCEPSYVVAYFFGAPCISLQWASVQILRLNTDAKQAHNL